MMCQTHHPATYMSYPGCVFQILASILLLLHTIIPQQDDVPCITTTHLLSRSMLQFGLKHSDDFLTCTYLTVTFFAVYYKLICTTLIFIYLVSGYDQGTYFIQNICSALLFLSKKHIQYTMLVLDYCL